MSFIMDMFGGGSKQPAIAQPILAPTVADAQPAADAAKRQFAAKGRAQTVLTSELGVGDTLTEDPKKLKKA